MVKAHTAQSIHTGTPHIFGKKLLMLLRETNCSEKDNEAVSECNITLEHFSNTVMEKWLCTGTANTLQLRLEVKAEFNPSAHVGLSTFSGIGTGHCPQVLDCSAI